MIFVYINISLDGFHLFTKHHLRREKSAIYIPHSMHGADSEDGVHSVCSASQKLLFASYVDSGDEIVTLIKYDWTASPSEKRIPSYSSQHGVKGGYSFSLYCKFEMIL